MAKFAKLFDITDDSQVLVAMEQEQEGENPFPLKITTEYAGIIVSAIAAYKQEEDCVKEFHRYSLERAEKFYNKVVSLLDQADEEGE